MEKFQELREKAKKNIAVADHILTQTYPLVRDSKLLLLVLENIFLALTHAMGSVLYYEREFKRVPPFQNTFESKFDVFESKIIRRQQIDERYASLIKEVKDIIMQHKKSPVEFRRKERFVICGDDYRMRSISVNEIKEYIKNAKEFIIIADKITMKREELFR